MTSKPLIFQFGSKEDLDAFAKGISFGDGLAGPALFLRPEVQVISRITYPDNQYICRLVLETEAKAAEVRDLANADKELSRLACTSQMQARFNANWNSGEMQNYVDWLDGPKRRPYSAPKHGIDPIAFIAKLAQECNGKLIENPHCLP